MVETAGGILLNHILMSCWPVLSGIMRDAFYLLSRVPLLAGNLRVLPPRKHHGREKQLFLKDPLEEVRILKSMRNKRIVVMKAVCENPLDMMLEYVFFDFSPFGLEGRISSLQDYFDYISAIVGRICADLGPDCSLFVKSTKFSGMTELIMTIDM